MSANTKTTPVFALSHVALAALAISLAMVRSGSEQPSAEDLPAPLALAASEPMVLDRPATAVAPKAASRRAAVRVSALKVDARALAAARLESVAAPTVSGRGLSDVDLERAEAAEALVPREAPQAEAVSEHLAAVFTPGRASGNDEYGSGWGLAHASKPSPMLALADR